MLGFRNKVTSAATIAAERGARDEVRKAMERLLQPVVEKAMGNGVEVSAKGPGGIVLGSIRLRVPDVAGGISGADVGTLLELLDEVDGYIAEGENAPAILAMREILNGEPIQIGA